MSKTYDANFEEWYKRLFNKKFDKNTDSLTKTENMSDEEFEVGTNLYNAYLQKNNLLDQYNRANTSLEKEKTQSQQQASIQLDKLKKYIPTQIKAQGLGGLGVSESTLLKANSDYQNRMGQIASNVGARQLDLLQSYNTGVSDIDSNLANANQATLAKYQEIARQEKEQQKALVSDHIENGLLMDSQNLHYDENGNTLLTEDGKSRIKEYIENNKEILGDLYDLYKNKIDSIGVYTNEQTMKDEAAKQKDETDVKVLEGKEYVKYNGAEYKLTSQLNSGSNEIAHNNSFIKKLKEVCGTSNPYDSSIPNGTTIQIKCDSSGADEFDFVKDVLGTGFNPWRNINNIWGGITGSDAGGYSSFSNFKKYVTYYNGNWYVSEKK